MLFDLVLFADLVKHFLKIVIVYFKRMIVEPVEVSVLNIN